MTRAPQAYRRRAGKSPRRLALALAAALAGSGVAVAHPGHEAGVYAALVGVDEAPEGAVGLRVLLVNNTPGAATLRGLSAPGAAIALHRRRNLLGIEFRQPVPFLRVESGHRVLLAAPGYVVSAEGLEMDAVIRGEVEVLADFGPLGTVPLEVAGAPQTSE